MKEQNEILKDLINYSIKLLSSPFKENPEEVREQIMINREEIESLETWNKSVKFDKELFTELNSLQKNLVTFFNSNWNIKTHHELLSFDKVYQSEPKIIIEWHAGTVTPHLIRYYIQFENNGFFKLTSSSPDFITESIKNLKSSKTNYRNTYRIENNGEIEMESEHFSLKGRIIENAIIDEKIVLENFKDRALIKEGVLLTIV